MSGGTLAYFSRLVFWGLGAMVFWVRTLPNATHTNWALLLGVACVFAGCTLESLGTAGIIEYELKKRAKTNQSGPEAR